MMMFTAAAYKNIFRAFDIIFLWLLLIHKKYVLFFFGSVVGYFAESRRWTFAQTTKIFAPFDLVIQIVLCSPSRTAC
jgi:hypothetical protein